MKLVKAEDKSSGIYKHCEISERCETIEPSESNEPSETSALHISETRELTVKLVNLVIEMIVRPRVLVATLSQSL